MKNGEKFKNVLDTQFQRSFACHARMAMSKATGTYGCSYDKYESGNGKKCAMCLHESLEWLNQEYKDPILDDVEREYLSAVIKPFREKISYIRKSKDLRKKYIKIVLCDGDSMYFPYLSNDEMYKGMELYRNYTLEELGL